MIDKAVMAKPVMVDVDDVLADFVGGMWDAYGPPVRDDVTSLEEMWPDVELERDVIENAEFHLTLHPMERSAEYLHTMRDNNIPFMYVSARRPSLTVTTASWLEHYGYPLAAVSCVGRDAKKQLIRDGHFSVVIDDSSRYLDVAAQEGVPHIIYDQPWNRHMNGTRAGNWREVVDELLRM